MWLKKQPQRIVEKKDCKTEGSSKTVRKELLTHVIEQTAATEMQQMESTTPGLEELHLPKPARRQSMTKLPQQVS